MLRSVVFSALRLLLKSSFPVPTLAKRFLTFPCPTQCSLVYALRWTVFPEGAFSQVPVSEWLRLLRLVDPLIQISNSGLETCQIKEGRGLLLLLLNQYLDVR
ncbi:hypothetical protein BXP70_08770 [Hymenobacter crusticola]|uniref:Uncharacterized protein n=1 Tax=Hymenobacter crusticola TaxID=1770526 RepID=A0A243WH55_9BACT|nr:hypothetical protein BXP70_08770 [Hymenobacter crusticola]